MKQYEILMSNLTALDTDMIQEDMNTTYYRLVNIER